MQGLLGSYFHSMKIGYLEHTNALILETRMLLLFVNLQRVTRCIVYIIMINQTVVHTFIPPLHITPSEVYLYS